MEQLKYHEKTYKIIGICMEVHRELGPGLLEIVYKDAFVVNFGSSSLKYKGLVI